jgi:tetratricopeptide (TPR) repeat protein
VERDPSFAPAWARLATALPWLEGGGEQGARAIAAAERAVVLAPGWAGAYTARAFTRNHLQLDFAGADEDLARAQALAPGSGEVLLAKCILERSRGRLSESAAACRGANDLDPLGVAARNQLTKTYLAMGDLARARQANGEAFERSPGSSAAKVYRCWLDILERNRGAAQDHCGSDLNDDDRSFAATIMAQTWGTPAEAEQAIAAISANGGEGAASWIAMVHAWRGDADRAFEWLERAYARREPALADIQGSPFLRKLAPDPRWKAFLRKMTLPTD